ncbi:MAG: AAA family ATPase [Nitrospirae bacterium]|nr:AAA family ATPase [Nitrospirota bacterium]
MTQGISIVIIDSDADILSSISKCIKGLGDGATVDGVSTSFETGFELIHKKKPMVVIMEVNSANLDLYIERIGTILGRFPRVSLFALCDDKSSDTILKVMRAGATEFLLKPLSEVDLVSALQKVGRLWIQSPPAEAETGRIYTFFSPKGGVGVSTLAINTAVNLYEITKKSTLLVDLDLEAGDVNTFLDMNPTYTISDVTANMTRLDRTFLQSVITKHKSGIYVLAEPQRIEDIVGVSADDIRKVLGLLKTMFRYIVVDTEAGLNESSTAALEMSDMILLTFVMSLPGIKNMQKYLNYFVRLGIRKDKINLVVNRYLSKGDIKIEDAERILKHTIFTSIPNDHGSAIASLNKGVPLNEFDPKSKLSQAVKELALSLTRRDRQGG